MAKTKQNDQDDVILDIGGGINKTEQFIENNKKPLIGVLVAIVSIVAITLGYNKLYLEPLEQDASLEIWKSQQYFQMDSLDKALYGDGNYLGFIDIQDKYGATRVGNLASYYIGLIYYKQGEYEDALEVLSNFSSNDLVVSAIALGVMGDAYAQMDDPEAAANAYLKAANTNINDFTTPIYLMKAGKTFESIADYGKAKEVYKTIMDKFPESKEGRVVEKYYYRVKALMELN